MFVMDLSGSTFRGFPAFGGIIFTAIRTCTPPAYYPEEGGVKAYLQALARVIAS
jgi:hypothetical protein